MKLIISDEQKKQLEDLIKKHWPHEYIIVWRDKPTFDSYAIVKLMSKDRFCVMDLNGKWHEEDIVIAIQGEKLSKSSGD